MIAEFTIQCTANSGTYGYGMMMTIAKKGIYSILAGLFILLTACSTTSSDPAEAYKGESASQIFKAGEEALRDKNYSEAIKRYEALDAQYPYGASTEIAQLHIIYAYYMSSDYASAEAAGDRFIHAHPTNPHVDYAYYLRGLANYYQNMGVFERVFPVDFSTRDLAQIKKSFNDFSELYTRFPNSTYAPVAHQYMVYLRNLLANHQLEVAQYYYGREAYVAAVDRASLVVQYYQGAPAVPQALVMMAKSYHQLHNTKLEHEIIEIIRYNYPHSTYLAEVLSSEKKPPSVVNAPGQGVAPQPPEYISSVPPVAPVKAAAAPVSQQRQAVQLSSVTDVQPYVPTGNGARGTQPITLSKLMESASTTTGFFALHNKPKAVQSSAAPRTQAAPRVVASSQRQQVVVAAGSAQSSEQASSAQEYKAASGRGSEQQVTSGQESVAATTQGSSAASSAPTAETFYPYQANGSRR